MRMIFTSISNYDIDQILPQLLRIGEIEKASNDHAHIP